MKAPPVLTFLLCAGLGWLAGGFRSPRATPPEAAPLPSRSLVPTITAVTNAPEKTPVHDMDFEALGTLLERLESADSAELARWLAHSPADSALREMIVRRWSTLDPEGAFAAVRADPRHHSLLRTVLAAWAGVDLPPALDAQLELGDLRPNNVFWSYFDPTEMGRLCTLLEERDFPTTHPELFEKLLPRLAVLDPVRAANLALKGNATSQSFQFGPVADVLEKWTRSDPEAAMRWAASQDNAELLNACASRWLNHDPLAALAACRTLPDRRCHRRIADGIPLRPR